MCVKRRRNSALLNIIIRTGLLGRTFQKKRVRRAIIDRSGVIEFSYNVSEINNSEDGGLYSKGRRLISQPRESRPAFIISNFQFKLGNKAFGFFVLRSSGVL